MFPPSDKNNVADRARSLRKSKSTRKNFVARYEEDTLENCMLCPKDHQNNDDCDNQAIMALSEAYSTKYMVNDNENNVPSQNRNNRVLSDTTGISYIDRQYGTPLEPIIEHERSYSTLRASISRTSSLRKIVKTNTPNTTSIMQENERILTGAISCVPCGAEAADGAIRQGHITGDREDYATRIAQTVDVGAAAPRQTEENPKERQEISLKPCASDRQTGKISLTPDDRAKSARCKPPVRYRICPLQESHNSLQNQLRVQLKQVENKIQLNENHNVTVDSKGHHTRTEKSTILSAIRRRRRQKGVHSKYRLMKSGRTQVPKAFSYCFA